MNTSNSNSPYTLAHSSITTNNSSSSNMEAKNGKRGPDHGQLNLPHGFRFYPSDEELVVNYLCRKAASQPFAIPIIADVDLYKFDPWDLPDKALFGEKEWYFFSPRDRKYPNGSRPNRAAGSGYWKATGTDKPIIVNEGKRKVGVKKALVFYTGKAPKGDKTNWIMHEYRLADSASKAAKRKGSTRLDDWVLCRIYKKLPSATKLAMKEANEMDGCEDEVETFANIENEKKMGAPSFKSSFTNAPQHHHKRINEGSNDIMEEKSTKISQTSYNLNSNYESNQGLRPMFMNYYRSSNQQQMPINRNNVQTKSNIFSNAIDGQNGHRVMATRPTFQAHNLSLQVPHNAITETHDSPVDSSIVDDDYSLSNERLSNRMNTIGMVPSDHSFQLLLDGLPSPFGTRLDSFQPFSF